LEGPGLRPLLCSQDFGEWEELVASSLGHHRSRLLPGSLPFEAQIRAAVTFRKGVTPGLPFMQPASRVAAVVH